MRILRKAQEQKIANLIAEADYRVAIFQEQIAQKDAALITAARTIAFQQDAMLEAGKATLALITAFRLSLEQGIDISEDLEELAREYADQICQVEEHIVPE